MRLHKVKLLLKLIGRKPVIIPFAERNILSTCPRILKVWADADIFRVLVFRLKQWQHYLREAFCISADDLCGAIRRSIVMYQDLEGEIGFLHQKALQSLGDISFMIKGVADYADADLCVFHADLSVLPPNCLVRECFIIIQDQNIINE